MLKRFLKKFLESSNHRHYSYSSHRHYPYSSGDYRWKSYSRSGSRYPSSHYGHHYYKKRRGSSGFFFRSHSS